jgi:alpha-ribazole phosphatase/probable phosphoglycerate mutase
MDTYTRLYLVRHGQITNFSEGRFNGHTDVDITELGIRQMEIIAARLKNEKLAGVYCSNLIRTKKGAEIIAEPHGLIPKQYSNLSELNAGLWEGLNMEEIEERFPGALNERGRRIVDYRIPEGESIGDLAGRVIPALKEILNVNHGESVVLIAHGGVNRVILADAMKLNLINFYSIEQGFGCLNIIDYFSGFAVVKLMNGQSPVDFGL